MMILSTHRLLQALLLKTQQFIEMLLAVSKVAEAPSYPYYHTPHSGFIRITSIQHLHKSPFTGQALDQFPNIRRHSR